MREMPPHEALPHVNRFLILSGHLRAQGDDIHANLYEPAIAYYKYINSAGREKETAFDKLMSLLEDGAGGSLRHDQQARIMFVKASYLLGATARLVKPSASQFREGGRLMRKMASLVLTNS